MPRRSPTPLSPDAMRVPRETVDAVRRFNRFYTRRIGVLNQAIFGSAFSLGEMRLLWELGHQDGASASRLQATLGVDAAYLSRTLGVFRKRGWVTARPAEHDARLRYLELTPKGRGILVPLEMTSNNEVRALLSSLSGGEQDRLRDAMGAIESLLGDGRDPIGAYGLRDPRPGDLGWIVERHGALYARERGWDVRFEALVAQIVAQYAAGHDPMMERCWIAERAGDRVGCVMVVRRSPTIAQLRLLLVEPSARGGGLGGRLVDECIRFARDAGYARLMLWTQSVLTAARHVYVAKGFRMTHKEKHSEFGYPLVGETYSLALKGPVK